MCWSKIKEKLSNRWPFKEENRGQRMIIWIVISVIGLAIVVIGGAFIYQKYYSGRVYPGVYAGQYQLGGMGEKDVKDFVENFNNRISKEGLDFYFTNKDGQQEKFKINTVPADDSSVELVRLESDQLSLMAMSQGRTGKFWLDLWLPIYYRFQPTAYLPLSVYIDSRFTDAVKNYLTKYGDSPHNASVKISSVSPLKYDIVPEASGVYFDYDRMKKDLEKNLTQFSLSAVEINKNDFSPDIKSADMTAILPKLPDVLNYGNLGLNYIDPQTKIRHDWNITPDIFAPWIIAVRSQNDNSIIFGLDKDKVQKYLEDNIRAYVDTAANDAKFVMENDKVKEFQASQTGVSLNEDKTFTDLDTVFRDRNFHPADPAKTVAVAVDTVKPNVEISNVNSLGITDLIGSGYSTFHDSHTNRIKNIANAVKRLNGVLIKPGEEFSAIKYAGPFTAENGFLPESVIKGNELKNEIGGGMCQIGTTLFRMAMNSGMPITERRNHSLVVGYYADPINGNPGTDATLYEPNVDFKFLNDTGNYLLLQTSIDYVKQMLTFTLWGKNDGRSGSYTHPIVSKWIPAGDPQEVVSPTLKSGETKCQAAFRGAVASFVYTRFTSTSEKIEYTFDSYYRPLPKICMVGASSTPAGTTVPAGGTAPVAPAADAALPVETP